MIVETDHRNISFVKRSSMPQLARWRMRLQDHDFSIRYLSGICNSTSDGLSRQHVDEVEVSLHDVVPECSLSDAGLVNDAVYAEISALCTCEAKLFVAPNEAVVDADADDLTDASDSSASDSDVSSIEEHEPDDPARLGPLAAAAAEAAAAAAAAAASFLFKADAAADDGLHKDFRTNE